MAQSGGSGHAVIQHTRQAVQQLLALWSQRQWSAARTALTATVAGAAPSAEASVLAGDACSALGEYAQACLAYDRALALAPERVEGWFNRAAVRRFLGDLDGAEQDYDRCIALQPGDGQAWLNRSELRVQTASRNHIEPLEAALAAGCAGWEQEVPLRYALAKEYEDLGRHGEAWRQFEQAARLRRRHLDYRIDQDVATVDWLIQAFPRTVPRPAVQEPDRPIFILGMPRTGSTLVDRMVSSHSQVTAAGELPDFSQAVVAAARAVLSREGQPATGGRQQLVAASARADFRALGQDYLARAAPNIGVTPRFTDKMPLNYLYCGPIAAALPGARMVHVERHPLATCYGVFKVLFQQGYPFSYDLLEIADYYIAYRRLMDHWQALLTDRILRVAYEELVAGPEDQCRALLQGLALPWEPGCLEFHRNPAPTTTASAAQVRRPIYTSALAQWRHYEAQLQPVRRRLEAAGIRCD